MICVKSLHLRLNRILLLAVGLWPYERSKFVELQLILFYSILITFIIFQFTTFVTTECTPHFVIEILSVSTFFIVLLINYNMFCFNINSVKQFLEILQRTYDGLRDENEVAIIEKHGSIAKCYTDTLTLLFISIMFGFNFFHLWPRILDVVLPLNESRSHSTILIKTEYFIDKEKYFYLNLMHASVAIFVGGTATLATGTMIITYFQYACGMFKIASYRIEHAITNMLLLQTKNAESEKLIYTKIIQAVDMHRKAMEFVKFYMSKLDMSYLVLTAAVTISLSLNLFQGILYGRDTVELITPIIFLFVNYIYMLLANDCAQKVIDHNNSLYVAAYNTQWYFASLSVQKMMLFLLQRSAKVFNVTVGGLFVASLENAATMTSASITYFTVLYSMKQ